MFSMQKAMDDGYETIHVLDNLQGMQIQKLFSDLNNKERFMKICSYPPKIHEELGINPDMIYLNTFPKHLIDNPGNVSFSPHYSLTDRLGNYLTKDISGPKRSDLRNSLKTKRDTFILGDNIYSAISMYALSNTFLPTEWEVRDYSLERVPGPLNKSDVIHTPSVQEGMGAIFVKTHPGTSLGNLIKYDNSVALGPDNINEVVQAITNLNMADEQIIQTIESLSSPFITPEMISCFVAGFKSKRI